MQDPRLVYSQRLVERRTELLWRERRHRLLGYVQLVVVAAGLAMVWLPLAYHSFSILWVLAPAAIFVTLMLLHDRRDRPDSRSFRAARATRGRRFSTFRRT